MKKIFSRNGFTLIEVLVVISIIGILSTILYASFGDARIQARNKALRAEVKETQLALELYKSQNGAYPVNQTEYESNLTPDFIADLPDEDKSANSDCLIEYDGEVGGSWYKLTAVKCIGGDEVVSPNDVMARCPSSCSATCGGVNITSGYLASDEFTKSFAVFSAGGQCQ
ncbi:type II secretion system protein [Candidatus Nomurabacteria bacterium]|nr:type II secretion system protein [Candidatus Kaiserbacteria bacterium]MCB9815039.1 type II secretion system protein [Candidatus Nomurabacteria bacterium]